MDGREDLHTGLDFAAPRGATVVAALPGTVRLVAEPGEWHAYGRLVVLQHEASPAPVFTLYAHLESAAVRPGEVVHAGQPIATVGDTAGTREDPDKRTRAPHLHFELLTRWPPTARDADRIDPTPYFTEGQPSPAPVVPSRKRASSGAAVLALAWLWARKASAGSRGTRPAPGPRQRYSERTS